MSTSPPASPSASRGPNKPGGGVDECLQKVRDAERSLQTSLHLAREALISLADQHQPEPEREDTDNNLKDKEKEKDAKDAEGVRFAEKTSVVSGAEHHHIKVLDKERAQAMFNTMNKDNQGRVSINELRKLMDEMRDKKLTDAEFDHLKHKLFHVDKDGDGLLNFEEFFKGFCLSSSPGKDGRSKARELQKDVMRDFQQERMSPEQHVQIKGVAMSCVTKYLRKELEETAACLQLPWAALIFIFYFFAVVTHFDLDRLHAVDQAITFDIHENANFAFTGIIPFENGRMGHKNIVDVNSIADFWSFMNMGLVPIFWPAGWDVNEARINAATFCGGARNALKGWGGYSTLTLANLGSHWDAVPGDCPEKGSDEVEFPNDTREFFGKEAKMDGTYLLFHKIVGGLRMRQERVPLEPCPDRVEGLKSLGMCTSSKWSAYWLKPEIQKSLTMELELTNQPGGETKHLLSYKAQDEIRRELRQLENQAWFSPQTRKIELLFTTYNANEDILTATYVLFFLNRGGHIFKNIEPVSFYLDPYHDTWVTLFYDLAWCLLCAKLLLEESWEIVKHWKQLGIRKGTMIYMSLANSIDWISLSFSIFLINFWMLHLGKLSEIKSLLSKADMTIQGSFPQTGREEFFDKVDFVVRQTHDLRNALALYPFVIVSRFFKAFASQPRLAMVTKTFARASVDIFHFGVVFMVVFTIFAFSAMILWGQELEEFANEGRAFHTSFRILLGDFDWEPMTSVGRRIAYVWFWTFVWLVNLIMFNMLLAIIMDVYTDVKSGSADAETLWSQSVEIFYRTRDVLEGKTVPLSAVLTALDPTDLDETDENQEDDEEDTILFPSTLAAMVPKITDEQAFSVLLEAQKLKMSDERDSDTLSEALVRIGDIDDRTKTLQEHIVRLIQVQQYTTGDSGAPPKEKSAAHL